MIAALLGLALQAQAASARVEDLAWLRGRWESRAGQSWAEEQWSVPRGERLLGFGRTGVGRAMLDFEFFRIEPGLDGMPVYVAQPGGRPPVLFRLVASGRTSATFENRNHDYPQRIVYRRSGNRLTAVVSLADGSRPISWTFRRRR